MLKKALLDRLEQWPSDKYLMFKVTLPEEDNFYSDLVDHPNVVRVVALSGGYSREEANRRLSRNKGVVASFSRALTEGLSAQQSDEDFDKTLDVSIQSIFGKPMRPLSSSEVTPIWRSSALNRKISGLPSPPQS